MNVVSLFGGIETGCEALKRSGIKVNQYYSSEIDKYAMFVANKNFPEIIQVGDVTKLKYADGILGNGVNGFKTKIDLLIGGSPCQDLSQYKTSVYERTGLSGERSGLFFEYLRLLEEIKPRYFLLENVMMRKEDQETITNLLGVEPIMINSNLVCAAERKRLYWTNIPNVTQPEDKGIILRDIVLDAKDVDAKFWYSGVPFTYNGDDKKVQATLEKKLQRSMKEVYNLNGKCNTLKCDGDGGDRQIKVFQNGMPRKLTPIEYERLQNLPDNYTDGISNSRRYTAIGNGWTTDVIAHIFKGLKDELNKNQA